MKKLLAFMLALMMTVCVFAACDNDTTSEKSSDDEKVTNTADDTETDDGAEENNKAENNENEDEADEAVAEEDAENVDVKVEEVSYTDDELEQMLVGEWYNVGEIESYGVRHEYKYAEELGGMYVFNDDGSYSSKSLTRDYNIVGKFMVENGVLYLTKSEFLYDVKWEGDLLVLVSDYSNTGFMYSRTPELITK